MYPSRVHTVLQTGRSSVLRHLPLLLEVPVSIPEQVCNTIASLDSLGLAEIKTYAQKMQDAQVTKSLNPRLRR